MCFGKKHLYFFVFFDGITTFVPKFQIMSLSKLFGREQEIRELQRCVSSDMSEFVIVYGRRRVGKTYLVDQFFDYQYDFSFVGGHNVPMRRQLSNFAKSLKKYAHLPKRPKFEDWYDAFDALEEYMESLDNTRRKIIFIDEMPWVDTQNSEFVEALENFWNGWAARRQDILFIASGSASSWMVDNLVENEGGLHDRIRTNLYIRPFTLKETEEYLRSRQFSWDRYQIIQTYMAFGGIPYYLSLLNGRESLAQNIDRLFFRRNGDMRNEFDELYNALFRNSDSYISIVKALAIHREGLTRQQIINATKIEGGVLTKMLRNLERCDFIISYQYFGHKAKDVIYRLIDFYTLFYYHFIIDDRSQDEQWWSHHIISPAISSWQGFSFEVLCLLHLPQIKRALGISGMATSASAWRIYVDKSKSQVGSQIDLIISRADRIIHLCEIKFSTTAFHLTSAYEEKLRHRAVIFQQSTKTTHSLVHTFVTTYGIANAESSGILHSQVVMDDLFSQ